MPKIVTQDIKDLGFTFAMFNKQDETTFGELIDGVIAEAADELEDRIGSAAYALAANAVYVKLAEKCMAAAEMVRRRINIILNNMNAAGAEISTTNERKQREDYLAEAEKWIATVVSGTTTDGQNFACGALITSHFEED